MPDSITVAGIDLRLASFQERAQEWRGEEVASFDNTLQNGRDRVRRTWEGTTLPMAPEDEQALRTAIAAGGVVCTGLVLYGESVLCNVTVESAQRGPDVQGNLTDWSQVNSTLSLVFKEVSPA